MSVTVTKAAAESIAASLSKERFRLLQKLAQEQMPGDIVVDECICGGQPVLAGTRIPVWVVMDHLANDYTIQQIQEGYPDLTDKQIRAAGRFAALAVRIDNPDDEDTRR